MTVTEVKEGTVVKAMGTSIIVQTDGGYKMFSQGDIDKRGIKIMRDGKPAPISDFRENDKLTATIITTMPPKVMTQQEVKATLAKSGGGAAHARTPAAGAAAGSADAISSAAAAAASTSGATPKKLPKTASLLPLLGVDGIRFTLRGLGPHRQTPSRDALSGR